MIKDWKNKKVGILGLGVEGISSAKFLAERGAEVTILERKRETDIDREILENIKRLEVDFKFGEDYLKDLEKYDVLVRSPGIPINKKELQEVKKKGVEITSQTKLFFDLCPCPIIGVTGTKGKGTTSSLIYEMLKKSGRDAYLGGNIGKPPLDFLDKLSERSIVVLELSSFQLQDVNKSPFISVMLMIVPEHLNYHKDMEEYVDAKRNILRFQEETDYAILNRDYIASNESDILTAGKVYHVTRERSEAEQGTFIKENAIWMRMQGTTSNVAAAEWKIIDTEMIALPGRHNWENAAAAATAATLAGASKREIVNVLSSFKGLPHRLELVREVGGVRYYDDSFSTTPETAIAAIEAFAEPEILILGGSSKNSDFTELGKVIGKAKNIKAIIGIGEEWERIKFQISNFKFPISNNKEKKFPFLLVEGAGDMETVVKAAEKIARPGDVVLLSPACASFGMFKNYKERGEQFRGEVERL